MARPPPMILHLPAHMSESFNLARQLAAEDMSWAHGFRLLADFEMRTQEQAFAKTLLARKRNVWLFRCNQRCFCGDFVTVDMSAQSPAQRQVYVIELKMGEPLQVGVKPGTQMARWRAAVAEIAERYQVVVEDCPVALIIGNGSEVLTFVAGRRR